MTTPQPISADSLPGLDLATLTPLVNRVLGRRSVAITSYTCAPVNGGAGDAGSNVSSVYRLTGAGQDQGATLNWSMILKIIGTKEEADELANDPANPEYWRRELLAYQSGQLDHLPGGLAAPRCWGITERSAREGWLWLEDLIDEVGARWPLERYGLAARHLGQFNGAYLDSQPLPAWPWLSRGWLRAVVNNAASGIELLRIHHDHPLVSRWAPPDNARRILHFWEAREWFLDALDRLPQTLCHHDAFRRNLFARHDGAGNAQTVAIDWAFPGVSAVGVELAPLVQASLSFGEADLAQADKLEEIVLEGYLDGLRDAGWRGDPRAVEFAYAAASMLIYAIGYPIGLVVALLLDESNYTWLEQVFGLPMASWLEQCAKTMRRSLDLSDRARASWPDIGSPAR